MGAMRKNAIYMDYAATTPLDKKVKAAMTPYFNDDFGNPGSLHSFGQKAAAAVFDARRKIALSLGCLPDEIIFTGSATEANNLALRGAVKAWNMKHGTSRGEFSKRPKIIISAVEHESVAETARDLEKDGVEVVVIPVSREGIVDIKKLRVALDNRTVLVSVMYANNEIGTIQPISKIANIIREYKQGKIATQGLPTLRSGQVAMTDDGTLIYPLLHTDAAQAFQYLPCQVRNLGVDLMTLSAHKIYGPQGMGLLYLRSGVEIASIITGGGQERGLRSGTENTAYIVGFGEAVRLAEAMREKEARRVLALRDYFWNGLQKIAGVWVELNGSLEKRLPNNLNIFLNTKVRSPRADKDVGPRDDRRGVVAHDILIALDILGVAVSAGSACHARMTTPSRVILALGFGAERAGSSVRFTLGRQTTKSDIDKVIVKLNTILK